MNNAWHAVPDSPHYDVQRVLSSAQGKAHGASSSHA